MGSASAVAGSARYVIVVHSEAVSPPAAKPPTGNHPVREARMRSANDVTRGGTETKMSESARASAVPTLCRLPVMMPAGTPTSVARSRAVAPSRAVFQARSATSWRTGRPYFTDSPKIEPHGAAQPVAVARVERTIESETVTLGRGDSGIEVERVDRIAGCRLDQHQRRRRDDEHEQHREEQAAKQIGHADYLAAASVSALQSRCGTSGAGVGLRTFGEVASVTREATK